MPVGYDTSVNYSFTYQELLDAVTKSTYNRGELTLSKDGKLNIINNHVARFWKNGTVTSRTENARIRSAVYKAIADQYQQGSGNAVNKNFLNEVRRVLFAEGRAGEALSRDEVRNLLNANKKEGWISLRSRQIRAIKTSGASVQFDGDKNQIIKDVIRGYDVKTSMNSTVLKPTKNKRADREWQQSLETAKSSVRNYLNSARVESRLGKITQQTKDILTNHFNLFLEERWATAATKGELPTEQDIQSQVDEFLRDADGLNALTSIDVLARKQSFAVQQLALSGIDLIDVGKMYAVPEERVAALADLASTLTVAIMKSGHDLRTICDALVKIKGADACKNLNELKGQDLDTMTRLQLHKACVAIASIGNGSTGVEALKAGDVTLDGVLNSDKMPKDANKAKAIETAMKGPQGQRLLSILQGGVFAYGQDMAKPTELAVTDRAKATGLALANLLGSMANYLPQDMSEADMVNEMQNTIRDIADCLGAPSTGCLKAFVKDSSEQRNQTVSSMAKTFRQLRYDRQRVNVALSSFANFMAQRIGADWREKNPGLSDYVKELERTAKNDLTFMIGDAFNVEVAKHAQMLRAPQLVFKLEQMKEVISLLPEQQTENPGEVALSIVRGENLVENQETILAKANGKALLEAIDTECSDKGVIGGISWPSSNSPERTELLKKLLSQHAYEFCAERADLEIETTMDLQAAWKELLGDPSARDRDSLAWHWNDLYVTELDLEVPGVFEPAKDKPNAEHEMLANSGIDLTKVDVETITSSCDNKLFVGSFIHALLSRENAGLEVLNQQIATISELTPASVGLDEKAMTDNEKRLFVFLKWSIPEFSLNGKGDAEVHPLAKIFTEIRDGLNSIKVNSPEKLSDEKIQDFRANMMDYLLRARTGNKELVRMIQRQVAEAADSNIAPEKKFTVAGHLQGALTELETTQTAFNQAAAKYMESYGQYIDQDLSEPKNKTKYIKMQLDVEPSDCNPLLNFEKMVVKTEHLKKRGKIIENRIKMVGYVNDKVKNGTNPDVGKAAIRVILNSNRSAFVTEAGADFLIDSLTGLANKLELAKWEEDLSKCSQPEDNAQIKSVLTEMFNETIKVAQSFWAQEKTIFAGKSEIGADERTSVFTSMTLEFLGLNRDLSRIVNKVLQDKDVHQAVVDLCDGVTGETLHMASGWGAIAYAGELSNWLKHFDSQDMNPQG